MFVICNIYLFLSTFSNEDIHKQSTTALFVRNDHQNIIPSTLSSIVKSNKAQLAFSLYISPGVWTVWKNQVDTKNKEIIIKDLMSSYIQSGFILLVKLPFLISN